MSKTTSTISNAVLVCLVLLCSSQCSHSLLLGRPHVHRGAPGRSKTELLVNIQDYDDDSSVTTRRGLLVKCTGVMLGLASLPANQANAAEEKTMWISGKPPKIPGQKPKDKNDVSGTKKDPRFLRSISDCKSQCENTLGPDSLAKSKEQCLDECQLICCETYEQCTFAIVPRI